jgi:hypothetical protein
MSDTGKYQPLSGQAQEVRESELVFQSEAKVPFAAHP